MSETSAISNTQLSLFASTTSPVSVDGNGRSDSPSGQSTERSGLAVALVNLSRLPASARRMKTREIYGPLFFGSSPSAGLQRSLASRLAARLPTAGSTEYAMTWRELVTPSGRPYCQLAVSARRTSAKGSTGWPSPNHNSTGVGNQGREGGLNLQTAATLAGWATPTSRDDKDGASDLSNVPINSLLGRQATLSTAATDAGDGSRLNVGFSLWLMAGDSVTPELIRTCPRGLVPSKLPAT